MATAPDSGVSSMTPDSTTYGLQSISVGANAEQEKTSTTVHCEQEAHADPAVSSSNESSAGSEHSTADRQLHSGRVNSEKFDFTLWYHEDDHRVADEVREFLEDKHHLRGFIEERDFIAGKPKFHNLDRGVNNSDKILIVVSRNSAKSPWFERIMHQSLITALESHQTKFCVIPIYIDLEKKETPSALKTLAGVKYTAKHFWKRLETTMGLSSLTDVYSSPCGSISPSDSSIAAPIQTSNPDSTRYSSTS